MHKAYANRIEGFHNARAGTNRRVPCNICGDELAAGSLRLHLESQHGVYRSFPLDRRLVDSRLSVTYRTRQTLALRAIICPVPCCPYTATTLYTLRQHFCYRHPQDSVFSLKEGMLPHCGQCGMQVSNPGPRHEQTKTCRALNTQQTQHAAAANLAEALARQFSAYWEKLTQVAVFKYLGRLVAMDNNDAQAVRARPRKARAIWSMLSKVLRAENATPRVCGMFYRATVQAVLLYSSKTWVMSPASLRMLEGFHTHCAYHMTGLK